MHLPTLLFILLSVLLTVSEKSGPPNNSDVEAKQSDNVESLLTTKQPETRGTSDVQESCAPTTSSADEETDKIMQTTNYPTTQEDRESSEKYFDDHIKEHEVDESETYTPETSTAETTITPEEPSLTLRIVIIVVAFATIAFAICICIMRKFPKRPEENEPVVYFKQESRSQWWYRLLDTVKSSEAVDIDEASSVIQ